MPFDIPDNWTWIRQKNVCWLDNGTKSKGEDLPYLEAKVLRGKQNAIIKSEGIIVTPNERLILVDGENSGEIMATRVRGYMGSTFKIFSAVSFFNYQFLLNIFLLNKSLYKNSKTGAAIPHLNKELFKENLIAVPPLEEQQRIVDKIAFIEPLLAEYDSIEKELSALEAEFPEKLKKSILQYAIEGKLVKQDPNDEPASVLLERIKAEKERLIKEGKIKRDKNESYIYQGDDKNYYENLLSYYHEFKTPNNWICTSLINVCVFIRRGRTPIYSDVKEIPVVAQKCNQKNGVLSLDKALFINPATILKYGDDKIIKVNDIIVNSTGGGTVGRVALIPESLFEKYKIIVTDSHITTIRSSKFMAQQYLYYYLKSPLIFDHVEQRCEGSTNQMELYPKTIIAYPLPVPPLAEQKRISGKISSLFALIKS